MTKILTLKNISKKYNDIKVLDNINIDINKNDFISLIGPSGCGKSTLLNIISNIDKDYIGSINIKTNNISYMFQNDCLLPWLTIYQNATLAKIFNNNIDFKYIDELLIKYGLYEYKDKYINSLSGGLKQRLALIRALATKPDILLLDEPFSALDFQTRLKLEDDVKTITSNNNITTIMVTHDINEAISMSNKVITLSNKPCKIKNIYNIDINGTTLEKRLDNKFNYYYNLILSDLNEE
jgi:NitT/TauT family transport system ATP-binding protein